MAAAVPILAAATPVSGTAVPAGPDATTLGFHIIPACIGIALPSRDPSLRFNLSAFGSPRE